MTQDNLSKIALIVQGYALLIITIISIPAIFIFAIGAYKLILWLLAL